MNTGSYEVTVLVASYNPSWNSMKRTLCSILNQEGIHYQIVVSDDGSEVTYFEKIKELLCECGFEEFKLVRLDRNKGTCYNIYSGLLQSEGKYIKIIGPGDCLFDKNTLANWVSYAKEKSAAVCFGDAVFFTQEDDGTECIVSERRYPQNVNPFISDGYCIKEAIYSYVLLGDVVWGANLITEKEIMIQYLKRILGRIKYAEDMIYRMMISNGEKMVYFPENVIWYEYGTGISTSKNNKWNAIIGEERRVSNEFVAEENVFKGIERKRFCFVMKRLADKRKSWIKYVLFPGLISRKIKKEAIGAVTGTNYDINSLYQISRSKVNYE